MVAGSRTSGGLGRLRRRTEECPLSTALVHPWQYRRYPKVKCEPEEDTGEGGETRSDSPSFLSEPQRRLPKCQTKRPPKGHRVGEKIHPYRIDRGLLDSCQSAQGSESIDSALSVDPGGPALYPSPGPPNRHKIDNGLL